MERSAYILSYGESDWKCIIKIDNTIVAQKIMKNVLAFYKMDKGVKTRTEISKAFIRLIFPYIINISQYNDVKEISEYLEGIQGFPKFDGTDGIQLISCDSWEFTTKGLFIDEFESEL